MFCVVLCNSSFVSVVLFYAIALSVSEIINCEMSRHFLREKMFFLTKSLIRTTDTNDELQSTTQNIKD
jgi:hypothetical protein